MAIAVFGPKTFNVSPSRIYPLDDFKHSSGLNIEEQKVDGVKPSTYIEGESLDEVNFTVPLIRQPKVNIRLEMESWINLKASKIPYLLLVGNRPISKCKFLLINVQLSEVMIDKFGNYQKAKIELQFKEFVRYGKKKEEKTATTKNKKRKTTPAGTKTTSKQNKKRDNPNATISKADGTVMEALEKEIFGGKK